MRIKEWWRAGERRRFLEFFAIPLATFALIVGCGPVTILFGIVWFCCDLMLLSALGLDWQGTAFVFGAVIAFLIFWTLFRFAVEVSRRRGPLNF